MKCKFKERLQKIYTRTTKPILFLLIGILAFLSVSLSYQKIREVKAFVVVDDLAFIVALFAASGFAYTDYTRSLNADSDSFASQEDILNTENLLKNWYDSSLQSWIKDNDWTIPEIGGSDPYTDISSYNKIKTTYDSSQKLGIIAASSLASFLEAQKRCTKEQIKLTSNVGVPIETDIKFAPDTLNLGFSNFGSTNQVYNDFVSEILTQGRIAATGIYADKYVSLGYANLSKLPNFDSVLLRLTPSELVPDSYYVTDVYPYESTTGNFTTFAGGANALINGNNWFNLPTNNYSMSNILNADKDLSKILIFPSLNIYYMFYDGDYDKDIKLMHRGVKNFEPDIINSNSLKSTEDELPSSVRVPTSNELLDYLLALRNADKDGDSVRKQTIIDNFIDSITKEEYPDKPEEPENKIPEKQLEDLPQNVQDAYNKYKNKGWKGNVEGQTKGTTAGGKYKNKEDRLPKTDADGESVTYKEWDVNNKQVGKRKDGERFVTGSDGSIYFTDSHYGDGQSPTTLPPFVKLPKRSGFMGNQTENIGKEELNNIRSMYQSDSNTFYVELNGTDIQKLTDYFNKMSEIFDFPIPVKGFDGYNGWMRDLTWIDKNRIVITIDNYKNFMGQDIAAKADVLEEFNDTIMPWWEHEVLECMVEGETKEFLVYLVD